MPTKGKIRAKSPSMRVINIFLAHERCLDIDLGELGLAVRPQILVAETARDLHIPPAAGDLEELLEELW